MSSDEISQPTDEVTLEQGPEVAIVPCSRCGADVLKTGFVEVRTTYQTYIRKGGHLVKSYSAKSESSYVACALCRETVGATVEALTGSKSA